MVLGSDLIVFGKPGHERVSLQLQDVEQPMTQADGIDMFLDNVVRWVTVFLVCLPCVLPCVAPVDDARVTRSGVCRWPTCPRWPCVSTRLVW